ncbi:MAG TPA: hypothetical protein VMV46_11550 [Thermoanaerobaculia bacterium]|nr:hypothetical protein [Thermoanaerobaculia bacterium]
MVRLVGFHPLPVRLAMVALHLLVALLAGLLFVQAARLLPTAAGVQRSSMAPFGWPAWLVVIVIASHPLGHETVFWYSALPGLLEVLLRIAAIVCAVRLLRDPNHGVSGYRWLAATLVLLLGAVFAKESGVLGVFEVGLVGLLTLAGGCRAGAPRERVLRARAAGLVACAILGGAAWVANVATIDTAELTLLDAGVREWSLRIAQAWWRLVSGGMFVESTLLLLGVLLAFVASLALAMRRHCWLLGLSLVWLLWNTLPVVAVAGVADAQAGVPVLLQRVGVGDDRYYYGAVVAFAFVVAAGFQKIGGGAGEPGSSWPAPAPTWATAMAWVCLLAALLGWSDALRRREAEWSRAGEVHLAIEVAIRRQLGGLGPEEVVCVPQRPDQVGRAVVFRNGVTEVVERVTGVRGVTVLVPPFVEPSRCDRTLDLGSLGEAVDIRMAE